MPTPTQRATEALRRASELLNVENTKILNAAVLEEAVECLAGDSSFAMRVRTRMDAMATPTRVTDPRRSMRQPATAVELVPIKVLGAREVNPAAPPDPYFLLDLYGPQQLRRALSRYKLPQLKLAVQEVQKRNPGTKPTNQGRLEPVIDYIVQQVAGI